jgi:nitrogen fixation/metabolism regulation signal transduction histidine kinase
MMRIQTKFMLATLLMTLLPVFPLYFLIENFYQTSTEIGLNPQVESALDAATDLSQALFSEYKQEVLALTEAAAQRDDIRAAFSKPGQAEIKPLQIAERFAEHEILAIDAAGNIAVRHFTSNNIKSPKLNLSVIAGYLANTDAQIILPGNNPETISAVAPVIRNGQTVGIVMVTAKMSAGFVENSRRVVEVNQMFKTIDLMKENLQQGFIFAFFIIYVPIAGLSLFSGYYFSKKITAPLDVLVEGTQKVAAGDWDHRVPIHSKDELGQLVASFNTMVQEVKAKQDQVIRLEKMAIWREMARVLAHEIKNPLTPIQLTVQQLQDKYSDEDAGYRKLLTECTKIINDEIQNLQQLVREFSDFARMPKLNLTRGNLNDLIEEAARLYSDVAISTKLDASLPESDLDFEKMRRVLINFFDNSRHSIREKGGGEIEIQTAVQESEILLQFADTGNGIPVEIRAKIFEPSFSTKKSGMGLGLAIVKRIIEEHGGSISFDSTTGEGTTFEIRLPVR